MADPLNLYLDKAGYTAVAHADKTSEVSRISSLNKVVYDGINIPTTQNPGEGDAVYLSSGHVLFIDGKTLNRAKLPNAYTPVGIVVYRTGTRILIAHHIPHFGKVASSWLWKIVPPSATGTSITFMARTSGYGNNVTVGTFTTDKNYITNMQGWCDDLNTWLTNHQPTSVGGADYDWYARVCTYRPYGGTPIQEVYVIADGMYNATQYTSPIVSSGATATKVIMSSIPAFTGVRLDNGGYGMRPLINLARNMSYYLTSSHGATNSITNGDGIIGKADFESNTYPAVSAYYGTWEKYLKSLYYTWP